MKISLCLLTWNEIEGCKRDVPLLPRNGFHEIFAVDGGSKDGTIEYLKSENITVHQQPVKSLNAAYHHAVQVCSGDALVVFFPKGTISPACVVDIVRKLKNGSDFVIASRNIVGAKNEEDDKLLRLRKWGVTALALFSAAVWRCEGPLLYDVLHGVKGFTVSSFRRMNIAQTGVSVDLEMVIRSYRFRISRIEIPVAERGRIAGDTHFKIVQTAKKLFIFLWHELLYEKNR